MLALTDMVLETPRVPDALFERAREELSPREIVELLLVVGWYWAAGRVMTTLDLEPEPPLGAEAVDLLRGRPSEPSA